MEGTNKEFKLGNVWVMKGRANIWFFELTNGEKNSKKYVVDLSTTTPQIVSISDTDFGSKYFWNKNLTKVDNYELTNIALGFATTLNDAENAREEVALESAEHSRQIVEKLLTSLPRSV